MNGTLLLTPDLLGGAFVARYLLTPDRRDNLSQLPGTMMNHCMQHIPEDLPTKVMMSDAHRIQTQNDEFLALLREQNELLWRGLAATRKAAPMVRQPVEEPREPASK